LSLDVTTNTTLDISIVNVNDNIEDDIPLSSSMNSHNIEQCDVPDKLVSNSTPCNISDIIKDLTNVHGDAAVVDENRNLSFYNNNVVNGKPFIYVCLVIHIVHSKIYLQ